MIDGEEIYLREKPKSIEATILALRWLCFTHWAVSGDCGEIWRLPNAVLREELEREVGCWEIM